MDKLISRQQMVWKKLHPNERMRTKMWGIFRVCRMSGCSRKQIMRKNCSRVNFKIKWWLSVIQIHMINKLSLIALRTLQSRNKAEQRRKGYQVRHSNSEMKLKCKNSHRRSSSSQLLSHFILARRRRAQDMRWKRLLIMRHLLKDLTSWSWSSEQRRCRNISERRGDSNSRRNLQSKLRERDAKLC